MAMKGLAYKPGACNIGMRNRVGRFVFGLFFFSLGVWTWAFLTVNGFHHATKVFSFIPFYLGFLGFYEAILGFCVQHAHRHTFDMR